MAALQLRPRSPSEIVDTAFQILRAHYPQFVMCSALAYTPWVVIQLLLVSDLTSMTRVNPSLTLALGAGAWLVYALMSAVIIVCASQAYLGDPVDVGEAVRKALPRLPLVLAGAVVRYFFIFVGLMLFLVGAVYVAARLFAMTPVIVLEGEGVGGALGRSSFLSQGRKRHVLNTLGLVAIIYWILMLGVQGAAYMLRNPMLMAAISAVFVILVYPVVAITEALLYFDTRIKSEGLDIELMAGALGAAPSREPAAP